MRNRRNYYRILHVQPEAPLEVIKASYRTLLTKMRLHPDLGGDHATAVLINEAYAVLSDPGRRQQYDAFLRESFPHATPQARRESVGPAWASSSASRPGAEQRFGASPSPRGGCLFCGAPVAATIRVDTRCPRCQSPMAQARAPQGPLGKEVFGRRSVPRLPKDEPIVVYPCWPHEGLAARLRDLSPVGVRFVTGLAVALEQLIRIRGDIFDGVARVVSLRPAGALYSVHARLLTVAFSARTGVFVASRA